VWPTLECRSSLLCTFKIGVKREGNMPTLMPARSRYRTPDKSCRTGSAKNVRHPLLRQTPSQHGPCKLSMHAPHGGIRKARKALQNRVS
jgi:hypothetical protein